MSCRTSPKTPGRARAGRRTQEDASGQAFVRIAPRASRPTEAERTEPGRRIQQVLKRSQRAYAPAPGMRPHDGQHEDRCESGRGEPLLRIPGDVTERETLAKSASGSSHSSSGYPRQAPPSVTRTIHCPSGGTRPGRRPRRRPSRLAPSRHSPTGQTHRQKKRRLTSAAAAHDDAEPRGGVKSSRWRSLRQGRQRD